MCVCVDPELQEFGAQGTQQAGGWGCVPVLGSVPVPAPVRHSLAVTCPQQPGPEIPPGSGALGSSPGSCSEQSGEREAVPSSTTSIPSLLPDPSGCCIQELLALHPQKKKHPAELLPAPGEAETFRVLTRETLPLFSMPGGSSSLGGRPGTAGGTGNFTIPGFPGRLSQGAEHSRNC